MLILSLISLISYAAITAIFLIFGLVYLVRKEFLHEEGIFVEVARSRIT